MSASKINEWMIQLRSPSSGEMQEFIRCVTLTVHYGDSLAVECTSVVIENIHYGFEHHLKWLSPQIVHFLRV